MPKRFPGETLETLKKSHVKHYKFKESHLCLSWFEDLHYKNNLFFSKNRVRSGEHGASLVPDWPRKRFNLSSTKSNCHHPNDWIETNYQTTPDTQVERFTSDILKIILMHTYTSTNNLMHNHHHSRRHDHHHHHQQQHDLVKKNKSKRWKDLLGSFLKQDMSHTCTLTDLPLNV